MLPLLLAAVIVVVALLVVAAKPRPAKPLIRPALRLTDLPESLYWFLREAGAESVLSLDRESGSGFLQFRVISRKDNRLQVDFGLPDAEWCRSEFDRIGQTLERDGYFCRVETDGSNQQVPRFMTVRLRGTPDELNVRMCELLRDVAARLGFDASESYTLRTTTTMSADYQRYLADEFERAVPSGRLSRILTSWLRRSADKLDESSD
jgi:hypothetical protein